MVDVISEIIDHPNNCPATSMKWVQESYEMPPLLFLVRACAFGGTKLSWYLYTFLPVIWVVRAKTRFISLKLDLRRGLSSFLLIVVSSPMHITFRRPYTGRTPDTTHVCSTNEGRGRSGCQ